MRALVALILLTSPAALRAQKHEIGLTLGRFTTLSRTAPGGSVDLGSGSAFQANYGYRFLLRKQFAMSAEVHFLANPLREITSGPGLGGATRDVATIYATPGLRVKFLPGRRVSPYVAGGGGYALYEQSLFRLDGATNEAPRFAHRGTWMFGGGVDVRVWKFLGARFEARDFYSGNPNYNVPVFGGRQHNVVVGGGFTLALGRRE